MRLPTSILRYCLSFFILALGQTAQAEAEEEFYHPMAVEALMATPDIRADLSPIMDGIKGADFSAQPFYSDTAMSLLVKKQYLGGFARGVEERCPQIEKVTMFRNLGMFSSTWKQSNHAVTTKTDGNGRRVLKFINEYDRYSEGLQDGWRLADQYGCSTRLGLVTKVAEQAIASNQVCFFGRCS